MSTIVTSATSNVRSNTPGGMTPRSTPTCASTNENSPICARLSPASTATRAGIPSSNTMTNTIAALPTTTTPLTSAMVAAFETSAPGSMSMPTETKNSEAKRSRRGNVSAMTCARYSDSPTTRPARKAPKASDSPANWVSTAVPSARPTTPSRNNSRVRLIAACLSASGTRRTPTR